MFNYSYVGAVIVGSGFVAYSEFKRNRFADMAKSVVKVENFMANPITPIDKLNNNPTDMKTKMELMIMRIQTEFCKALEAEEDRVSFHFYITLHISID